jgi:hypothetical protein
MQVHRLAHRYGDGELEGSSLQLAHLVLEALEDLGDIAGRRLTTADTRAAGDLFARSIIRVCRTPEDLVDEVRVVLDRGANAHLLLALGDGPHLLVSRDGCGVTLDEWCESVSIVPLIPVEGS